MNLTQIIMSMIPFICMVDKKAELMTDITNILSLPGNKNYDFRYRTYSKTPDGEIKSEINPFPGQEMYESNSYYTNNDGAHVHFVVIAWKIIRH